MKCPICDSELLEESFKEDICGFYQDVEKYMKCTNCKEYSSEYMYGNNVTFIGSAMFSYSHNSSEDYIKQMERQIKVNIEFLKEELKNNISS